MYHMYLYVGITLEGTFTLSVVYLRLLFQLCTSYVSTEAARFLFLLFLKCCSVAVLFFFLLFFQIVFNVSRYTLVSWLH